MSHAIRIHFICRGNILRSLVAETYMKSLGLSGVHVTSSGTSVNWDDPTEREYFADTLRLLDSHGIKAHAKDIPEKLTQSRIDSQDITVCMNQRVIDSARRIVTLPSDTINWNIVDIGEGNRSDRDSKDMYLKEIYKEITEKVDELARRITKQL
jgi:protein-tyrosine-phosphatase